MKIRINYVSNSSSSSYICHICGCEESGYDLSLRDIDMLMCKCGICYCEEHMMTYTTVGNALKELEKYKEDEVISNLYEKLLKKNPNDIFSKNTSKDDWENFVYFFKNLNDGCFMPECFCPSCNMKYIDDTDMLDYVLYINNLNKDQIEKEMKEHFKTRNELIDLIKTKK